MQSFFDDTQQLHHPQSYFSRGQMRRPQEVPERSQAILQALSAMGWSATVPPDQGWGPIAAVHDSDYVAFLKCAHADWLATGEDWGSEVMSNIYRVGSGRGADMGILARAARHLADGSCPVGPETANSAYAGAQSAIAAADAVAQGERAAFAVCRPPGHHARRDAAGGFCYLNNAAIAAQRLRETCQRVLILDVDLHHGQGIQEIFYHRADVHYISIHGDPINFYPVVTGHADECGEGEGLGYNLNLPLPHGSEAPAFFAALDRALAAAVQFAPDAVVLALGFDTYREDPQAKIALDTHDYGVMAERISNCGWPTAIVLEGGYHLPTLALNTETFFSHWKG